MAKMTHSQYVHELLNREREAGQVKSQPAPKAPERKNTRRLALPPLVSPEVTASKQSSFPEGQPIKALSIRQPYAGLIMAGIKNIENRSWFTNYTGPLAIVSTQKPDAAEWWDPMRQTCKRLGVEFPESLCRVNGSVLGIVDFRYIVWTDPNGREKTDHPILTEAQAYVWWNPNMYGFIFENPRPLLTPIPISGKLGLYTLPSEVTAKIEQQFK